MKQQKTIQMVLNPTPNPMHHGFEDLVLSSSPAGNSTTIS